MRTFTSIHRIHICAYVLHIGILTFNNITYTYIYINIYMYIYLCADL